MPLQFAQLLYLFFYFIILISTSDFWTFDRGQINNCFKILYLILMKYFAEYCLLHLDS